MDEDGKKYTGWGYLGTEKQMPHVLSCYVDLSLESLIKCVQLGVPIEGWKLQRIHW